MGQKIINLANVMSGSPKGSKNQIYRSTKHPKFPRGIIPSTKYGGGVVLVRRRNYQSFIQIRRQSFHTSKGTRGRKYGKNPCSQLERMRRISETKNSKYIFKRIYPLMLKEDLYILALEELKKKKGYGIPGSDKMIPDGISLKTIRNIISELRDERFQFKPLKRIKVPKVGGGVCLLSIPRIRDKIVQECMRLILERI